MLAKLSTMNNYGEYFKALRESKGFTLRDVEKKTEVSNAYLSQLETGKIKQPSPITLHKLAGLYGVGYETLMEKVGYPVLGKEMKSQHGVERNSLAARIGNLTKDEELELINYLKFIRNRRK